MVYVADRFATIITQPTTLCNLACSYCYLPETKNPRLMFPLVAAAVARAVEEQASPELVDVVWHCGEPLATPITHMRKLLAPFAGLERDGLVRHSTQTNATLIDDAWCELLIRHKFLVGISVDGPAALNRARVNWSGRESFTQTMRGIGRLREAGIPYTAICVITPESISHLDEIIAFFADLGCDSLGLNIEEIEGANHHRQAMNPDDAQRFWLKLWELQESGLQLPIRELDRVRNWLGARRAGNLTFGTEPAGPLPTVGYDGEVAMLSPELLGVQDVQHSNFVVGNVLNDSLPSIVRRAVAGKGYVRDFAQGLAACEKACGYWDFCRGAHAGNRYFENGSFASTETAHCRNTKQALVQAAFKYLTREEVTV